MARGCRPLRAADITHLSNIRKSSAESCGNFWMSFDWDALVRGRNGRTDCLGHIWHRRSNGLARGSPIGILGRQSQEFLLLCQALTVVLKSEHYVRTHERERRILLWEKALRFRE